MSGPLSEGAEPWGCFKGADMPFQKLLKSSTSLKVHLETSKSTAPLSINHDLVVCPSCLTVINVKLSSTSSKTINLAACLFNQLFKTFNLTLALHNSNVLSRILAIIIG